jgi:hypothetical protein
MVSLKAMIHRIVQGHELRRHLKLMLQKSRMLQIQDAKGEAKVNYCESLATQKIWHHRLS